MHIGITASRGEKASAVAALNVTTGEFIAERIARN
jgi:hypothetical protein